VATVDETAGIVVAHAPGSARVTARSEGAAAWVLLTVVPRPAPLATLEPDGGRPRTEAGLEVGVEGCYQALRSKDMRRVRALWRPTTMTDEDNLKRLGRVLQADRGSTAVGDRADGASTVGFESSSVEFSVPLTWRDASGGRTGRADFRAEFALNAGRWEMSSCRMVGSLSF
jgi:hypothetical protein